MATSRASLPLPSQRSCFELLAVDLPGPTGISPGQSSSIRPQDGPPLIHSISASFWNPLGSRTMSMRSAHRDFQSPMTHLGRCWRSWFSRLARHRGVGFARPSPGGQHEGAPGRRKGVTLRHEVQSLPAPFRPALPLRGPGLLNDRSKEFQCNVVRITAGQPRAVIGIDNATVGDTELFQPDH